jgi:hypothetical protein
VTGELFWDGAPLLRGAFASLHFTNKPGRYVPGACRFLANGRHVFNVAEPLKGSFGRCEVDLEIPWHLARPGQHVVELRVSTANAPHAVVKAFSRFEIIDTSRADDEKDQNSAVLAAAAAAVAPGTPAAAAAAPPPPYSSQSQEGGLFWVAVSTGEAVGKFTILNIKASYTSTSSVRPHTHIS